MNSQTARTSELRTEYLTLPEGVRLDLGIAEALSLSRSAAQKLLEAGQVTVNNVPRKANYKVRSGDQVTVGIVEQRLPPAEPQELPLDIVYEDDDLLVVNKAAGMVVHPAPGAWSGTLVNALLFHVQNLSGINGVLRPGIVHRIDRDTSGLLVVAKNDGAHQGLSAQLRDHHIERRYLAIVHGVIDEPGGTVDAPIGRDPAERKRMAVRPNGGKSARTHYQVLERFAAATYISARLETGRTHQIRVHLAYLKHPVLGDPVYGPKKNPYDLPGQLLHATQLDFTHPRTGQALTFTAPLPEVFLQTLSYCRAT
ncbi:MAG: RluA family pseudouridine synthase [Peptococcaceae bacterium]|jgi:23S rRNA pseudouridine1911/1915/1917 synthase|nr:RluA family pseudouridine synthase [Peptococcaceae bacterium]